MGRFVVDGRTVEVRRKLGGWCYCIDGRMDRERFMSQARASGAALLMMNRLARALARGFAAARAREAAEAAKGAGAGDGPEAEQEAGARQARRRQRVPG